jgi:hypothetical protein
MTIKLEQNPYTSILLPIYNKVHLAESYYALAEPGLPQPKGILKKFLADGLCDRRTLIEAIQTATHLQVEDLLALDKKRQRR